MKQQENRIKQIEDIGKRIQKLEEDFKLFDTKANSALKSIGSLSDQFKSFQSSLLM